jgi:ribosomal protein S27E
LKIFFYKFITQTFGKNNLRDFYRGTAFAPQKIDERIERISNTEEFCMSLVICPECGHEVSTAAVACTNCGRPMADPTIERNVVIAETQPPVRNDFPKWVIIPIAILGVVLLFIFFAWMMNSSNDDNTNLNLRVKGGRTPSSETRDTTTTIPSAPQTSQPSSVTSVPGESVSADKGTAVVEAKIATKTGGVQSVKNEKFYLLDKDLEDILDDAGIDDETGQGLRNAFGMSVLYPDRYGDTRSKALNAIGKHTKYAGTTDAAGKALIKDIKPDTYYLFGITKTRGGYAIWSSPVTITPGENILNLSPASITEVQ